MRIYEDTKATALERDGVGVLVKTPLADVRAARVALGTNAFKPLLRRLRHYIAPVYDYCMVTEPLTRRAAGVDRLAQPPGPVRHPQPVPLLPLDRGQPDPVGRLRHHLLLPGQGRAASSRAGPETWAKLSQHFFETFPQLDGVRFSHIWGGAIDTCSRFCVFWGTAMAGRVAYALGYTGLGVASTRFGAEVMLDLLDGRRSVATSTDFVQDKPLPFPPEPFRFARHPGDPLVARPRGPHRQAQPLAAHARPPRPRLRQLNHGSPLYK